MKKNNNTKSNRIKYSKKERKQQAEELARQNEKAARLQKAQNDTSDPLMTYADSIIAGLTPEEQKIVRRMLRETKYRIADPSFAPESYSSARRTVALSGPYAGNIYCVLELLDERLDKMAEEARIEQEKYDAWYDRVGKWGSRKIKMPSREAIGELLRKQQQQRGTTIYYTGDWRCGFHLRVSVDSDYAIVDISGMYLN